MESKYEPVAQTAAKKVRELAEKHKTEGTEFPKLSVKEIVDMVRKELPGTKKWQVRYALDYAEAHGLLVSKKDGNRRYFQEGDGVPQLPKESRPRGRPRKQKDQNPDAATNGDDAKSENPQPTTAVA